MATTPNTQALRRLAETQKSFTSGLSDAARALRPVLKRHHAGDVALDTAILSRAGTGVIAHAPVRLKRPIRAVDLYRRPHVLGILATTQPMQELVTEAELTPGAYAVQLRPVGGKTFAFDLLDADGERAIAAPAQGGPAQTPAGGTSIRILGFDVDINNPDEILNPFRHLICLSFLHWRVCFTLPRLPK